MSISGAPTHNTRAHSQIRLRTETPRSSPVTFLVPERQLSEMVLMSVPEETSELI